MTSTTNKTLRLVMPQWQGGDLPAYRLGAELLDRMLPTATGPVATIPVPSPPSATGTGAEAPVEDGIKWRSALLAQLEAARTAIASHNPARILTVGGDCLVDLAPIAWLNEQYGDDMAVLWVDAHPDIMRKEQFSHAHAHVLAMLMGDGDADFVKAVPRPVDPSRVLYVGVNDLMPAEQDYLAARKMTVISPETVTESLQPVLDWIRASGASKIAVHFDLDVLDPAGRSYLLFNRPDIPADAFDGIAKGKLALDRIVTLLQAVAGAADIVGLAITEFLPWEMITLANTLARLPLIAPAEDTTA